MIKIPSFLTFLCHNFFSCSNVDKLLYFIGIASSRLSVRMELGSHWADSHEIWYLWIFRKSVEKVQVSLKSDKNKGYFTWRPISFLSYLAHFLLECEMFQTKAVQKIKTHTLCSVTFFFLENRAVYENMWENNVEPGTPQMTIRRMRIACSIHKATNTHSEYVILIAFPLQPWLTERASVLLYTLPLLFYWVMG